LVVLRRVKAFHRSPSSPLSTETTSVNTSIPGSHPFALEEGPRQGGSSGGEPPVSPGLRLSLQKGSWEGPEGNEVRPRVASKECQNIWSRGPVPCYATLEHPIGRKDNRLDRLALLMVQIQWASPGPLPSREGESPTGGGRDERDESRLIRTLSGEHPPGTTGQQWAPRQLSGCRPVGLGSPLGGAPGHPTYRVLGSFPRPAPGQPPVRPEGLAEGSTGRVRGYLERSPEGWPQLLPHRFSENRSH